MLYLENIKEADIFAQRSNFVNLVMVPQGIPSNVLHMNLSNNVTTQIPQGDLSGLYDCLHIDLSADKLSEFEPGTFLGLDNLRKSPRDRNSQFNSLTGGNSYFQVAANFTYLPDLRQLSLYNNNIKTIWNYRLPLPLKLNLFNHRTRYLPTQHMHGCMDKRVMIRCVYCVGGAESERRVQINNDVEISWSALNYSIPLRSLIYSDKRPGTTHNLSKIVNDLQQGNELNSTKAAFTKQNESLLVETHGGRLIIRENQNEIKKLKEAISSIQKDHTELKAENNELQTKLHSIQMYHKRDYTLLSNTRTNVKPNGKKGKLKAGEKDLKEKGQSFEIFQFKIFKLIVRNIILIRYAVNIFVFSVGQHFVIFSEIK